MLPGSRRYPGPEGRAIEGHALVEENPADDRVPQLRPGHVRTTSDRLVRSPHEACTNRAEPLRRTRISVRMMPHLDPLATKRGGRINGDQLVL